MKRALRESRELSREEMANHKRILIFTRESPRSIPEIADELQAPTHEVVYWVMSMWKYGHLEESSEANEEGYFSYKANA